MREKAVRKFLETQLAWKRWWTAAEPGNAGGLVGRENGATNEEVMYGSVGEVKSFGERDTSGGAGAVEDEIGRADLGAVFGAGFAVFAFEV